ncbi:hypothetical protein [Streptomyces sp. NPDC093223]|uniref:hypothetical protein n=1 Tax=Streptomyces sp. NPDC093223 TaxID=3366033 RepID=UPI00381A1E55
MHYTLVHTFPSGEERRVSTPFPTIDKAAAAAALSLRDNGRASRPEAESFASFLAETEVRRSLKHASSGYAARIEPVDAITAPAPGTPLRVTPTHEISYHGAAAEVWEVRTRGAASLRTMYCRWTEDGEHWITHDPVMLPSGTFYTGGEARPHKAGDLYARTVRGAMRSGTFHLLIPERQLPQDAPTDQLLLTVA